METWENKEVKKQENFHSSKGPRRSPWGGYGKQCRNRNKPLVGAVSGVCRLLLRGSFSAAPQTAAVSLTKLPRACFAHICSAKALRSFCLHSKVTRWPSHLLWTLCVSHTSPAIQNWVSLSQISLPVLPGITNASFLLGGFASTATQRSLFKYRSGLCASGLNSLMLRLLCTTLAYRVFKVQV